MIKLVLDLWILKTDRSNDWTPHDNGELSGLGKFPSGLVLAPAKFGAITPFYSKKDIEVFPSASLEAASLSSWPACKPTMICCALHGHCLPCRDDSVGDLVEENWKELFCMGFSGDAFAAQKCPTVLQRWISEGRWRNRPMSSGCHGIHESQLLSVLSAVGARMRGSACKNPFSITWQVHVLPLGTSALTEHRQAVPAITLMLCK